MQSKKVTIIGRRSRLAVWGAAACALVAIHSPARGAGGDDVPDWRKPLPGTAALLDDGETVCDTVAHYREWMNYGNPPGCKKFPYSHGVVIEGVLHDPPEDTVSGKLKLPHLAKIRIRSSRFTGYVSLYTGLHPDIPKGTIIHLKRMGNETIRLSPSEDANFDSGLDLGEQATAKVVRYDPSASNRTFYVTVVDGEWAGRSGWIFHLDARGEDGQIIDEFAWSEPEMPPQLKVEGCDNLESGRHMLCSPDHREMPVFREGGAAKQGFDLIDSGLATVGRGVSAEKLLIPFLACIVADGTPIWISSKGWSTTTVLITGGPAVGCRGDTATEWVK